MRTWLLALAMTGMVGVAQEKTVTIPPSEAKTFTPQRTDPQQTRKEQTTQIVTNSAKGRAPVNYKGSATVDDDLRQRVKVALSTGSVGTQGIIASDQLTDIKVAVTNRVVTLSGNVASDKSKQTIGKRVAGLDGVKGVNNHLTINATGKPAHSDLAAPDGYSAGARASSRQRVNTSNK
jgi:hypothetical protein